MPDLSHELRHAGLVCGVDEAGRGPLAGPVVAAAVILPPHFDAKAAAKINDSKKLSATARAAMFDAITAGARFGIAEASVAEIDQINILQATFLAMRRAIAALGEPSPGVALIDGNRAPRDLACHAETIIKGDSISLSIAAASILAKVTRDRIMQKLAIDYPAYGWARNAGYGTAAHLLAIKQHGPTPHHRLTFAPLSQEHVIES